MENNTRIESYPSKEFQDISKIENLYTEWNINFDIELYRRLGTYRSPNLLEVYNQVLKDNSILETIKADSSIDKMNVIDGAISKFNYNDIKFFTENYNNIVIYNISTRSFYEMLKQYYGIYPEWVMSPRTVSYINDEYEGHRI